VDDDVFAAEGALNPLRGESVSDRARRRAERSEARPLECVVGFLVVQRATEIRDCVVFEKGALFRVWLKNKAH